MGVPIITGAKMYNVFYNDEHGRTKQYCTEDMTYETALTWLDQFIARYGDGITPKPYPNGKGYYKFFNARVEEV